MKKYLILKRSSQSIGTLRGEILWDSKKEAESQIEFQRKLHEAKQKVINEHWKSQNSLPFPKCKVIEIEIPKELLKF